MVAPRPAPQQHPQARFELANQLAFGGDISFPNSTRQLSAWNEIHTLATYPVLII